VLTAGAGLVDAVSYLALGHVFVANMTGNAVFLGFTIAGSGVTSLSSSLVAIAGFMLGAFIGGTIVGREGDHRARMLRSAGAVQGALIGVALVLALTLAQPTSGDQRFALLAPLALAMGIQNATALRLAVPELNTTVLTRTLSGLASETRLAGVRTMHAGRRLLAVAAMLLGALVGALISIHWSVAAAIALALALVLCVVIAMQRASRARADWVRTRG
jgi:uncharacterized membrane protein YoaK (UPF0700 family)